MTPVRRTQTPQRDLYGRDAVRRHFTLALLLVLPCACGSPPPADSAADPASEIAITATPKPVMSLSGQPLAPPAMIPNHRKLEADLAQARAALAANPDNPDAWIWLGRRLGYLWRYREAIDVLSQGIERFPQDARLYRHRGHRYITVRDFPRAQADLEQAARLIAGKPDPIEPDGAPNPAGIPRTTLAYNVWYHLGLARFLQADYTGALAAYAETMAVSDNDDAIVAVTDWMWMTLMRLDRRDEAARVLERISPTMDLLENGSYHRRLLMYQGLETPDALLDIASDDATAIATQGYGVGNYYLVQGDPGRAKAVFETIVAGAGWNAFGYIAAEADLLRLVRSQ